MGYSIIDLDTWKRKDHFEFFKVNKNRVSITCDIDVTDFVKYVKQNEISFFASFLYCVNVGFNNSFEFRCNVLPTGEPIVFDKVIPNYPILKDDNMFIITYVEEINSFKKFLNDVKEDAIEAKTKTGVFAKPLPENTYIVSTVPWISYSNICNNTNLITPLCCWGKFYIDGDKYKMPLTIESDHSLADGYQIAMLIKDIEKTAKEIGAHHKL